MVPGGIGPKREIRLIQRYVLTGPIVSEIFPDAVLQMITGIGSCSKAFLASAMGILIDDFASGRNVTALPDGLGSFNWDTKLQALFPGDSIWKLEDKWSTERANIRDLLSMVTGLTRYETLNDSHTLAPHNVSVVEMSSYILARTRP